MLKQVQHDGVGDGVSRSPIPWVISASLLFAASLAMRFPGVAMYDSVWQYQQAIDGEYGDWHPPIMARTWALLNHIHAGTAPFFVVQMLCWWGGLGLLSAALGRRQKHGAAALVLLVGIAPLWLGWATVVLKDAQMACCLVAVTGLAAHWRFAGRPLPQLAVAAILVLLAYATLVRGNAAFATVPFALALTDWRGLGRWWSRALATVTLILLVLAVGPLINHRILRAEPTGVERTLAIYDLAGIAHVTGSPLANVDRELWVQAEHRDCYTPYFWNPYGEASQCGAIGDALDHSLFRSWVEQIVAHPAAYAVHRLGHYNANIRLWVGRGEPDAVPPLRSERNEFGLGGAPTPGGKALIDAARLMALSPLGWPVSWIAAAVGLLWASRRSDDVQARLGRTLALSALCMGASYAVVSIASDLRYHLWSMVAAALGLILLADARALDRRRGLIAASCVLGLIVIATAARLGLAAPVYVPLPHH